MKRGIFYGVSVGPGDPELLTRKAVRILEQCPVIAAPVTRSGRMLACDIAAQAVDLTGKTVLPLSFPMDRDPERRRDARRAAADRVEAYLAEGADVAMLNLGDVSIYATYTHLMELLRERGYETEMIPGVPSFCAAAARLGVSLTEGDAPVHIGPETDLLDLPGTKVLMKAGRRLPSVLPELERRGLLEKSMLVKNCGLPGEEVCPDLSQKRPEDAEYFSILIVKE